METVKTIKGVNEETWQEFKSMAARNNVKMGRFFEEIVEEYKKKSRSIWDDILKGEPILSKEEADAMMETVKRLRSGYGFRK